MSRHIGNHMIERLGKKETTGRRRRLLTGSTEGDKYDTVDVRKQNGVRCERLMPIFSTSFSSMFDILNGARIPSKLSRPSTVLYVGRQGCSRLHDVVKQAVRRPGRVFRHSSRRPSRQASRQAFRQPFRFLLRSLSRLVDLVVDHVVNQEVKFGVNVKVGGVGSH